MIKSKGAFITQKGERNPEIKNEINELENLLSASGQTSQSTQLLKKRKEMREVDESLELMKKDYKNRMDACEERRLQFELKQAKMREQVLKFEKFIQENDAKRMRAENKAKQERKFFEDKVKEIAHLEERIQKLQIEQKELNRALLANGNYKIYLERIVEDNEFGYEEIPEVLNRYNTLMEANRDLMKLASEQEKEADEFGRRLQSLRTEKQNQLLVGNSILQGHQQTLEKLRNTVKIEEEEKIQREEKKKDISRELSEITQAIKNLFGRCFATMRIKPVYLGQKETASLYDILAYDSDIIHMRIVDLIEIVEESKSNSIGMGSNLDQLGGLNASIVTSSTESKEPSMMSSQSGQQPHGKRIPSNSK